MRTQWVTVGWTGHRPDVFRDPEAARRRVEEEAARLVARWPSVRFACGGQRGVDLWAASAAAERGVLFTIVLPVGPDPFTRDWTESDRAMLRALLGRAAQVEVADPALALGPLAYDRRNEILARRADRLVAVWTGTRWGGTFYTVCAARERGAPVVSVLLPASDGIIRPGRGV